jgi:hypothetical protein
MSITLALERSLTPEGIATGSNDVGNISDSNGSPLTFDTNISMSRLAAVCSTTWSRSNPRRRYPSPAGKPIALLSTSFLPRAAIFASTSRILAALAPESMI